MAGPGGALTSTDSQRPATPSTATSATVVSCQVRNRVHTSRVVAAGTTSSAVASSAPSVDSAATATSATSASSTVSGSAERAPRARAARGSNPVASQRCARTAVPARTTTAATAAKAMSPPSTSSRLPNSSVSTPAAEWKTSLARMTPSASAPTSTSAVSVS